MAVFPVKNWYFLGLKSRNRFRLPRQSLQGPKRCPAEIIRMRMYNFQATLQTAMAVYQAMAKAKLETAEASVQELKTELAAAEKARDEFEAKANAFSASLNETQETLVEAEQNITALEGRVGNLTAELASAKKDGVADAETIAKLEGDLETAKADLDKEFIKDLLA